MLNTRRRSLFQVTMYGLVRVVRAIQRQIQDFVLGIFDGMWHMSEKNKQMTALHGTSAHLSYSKWSMHALPTFTWCLWNM